MPSWKLTLLSSAAFSLSLSLSLYQQKVAPAAAKLSVCPAFCRRRRQHRTRRTRTRARMSDKSPSKQIATSVRLSVSHGNHSFAPRMPSDVMGSAERGRGAPSFRVCERRRRALLSRRQPESQRATPSTSTPLHSTQPLSTVHTERDFAALEGGEGILSPDIYPATPSENSTRWHNLGSDVGRSWDAAICGCCILLPDLHASPRGLIHR